MSTAKHNNTNCYSIDMIINNKHTRTLIDTGAWHICVNADFARRARLSILATNKVNSPALLGANGAKLHTVGYTTTTISIHGYKQTVDFVVINGL